MPTEPSKEETPVSTEVEVKPTRKVETVKVEKLPDLEEPERVKQPAHLIW